MNKISTWVPRFIMRQTVVGTIWIRWSSHTNCVCFIFYNKQCTKKVPKEHASTLVHKNYSIKQGRCSPFVENLLHGQVKWVDPILATVIDPSWRSYEPFSHPYAATTFVVHHTIPFDMGFLLFKTSCILKSITITTTLFHARLCYISHWIWFCWHATITHATKQF